jgi:hypothetical protein
LELQSKKTVTSVFCATLLLTSLAVGEMSPIDAWGKYPAYSRPPLVPAAVLNANIPAAETKANEEPPPARPAAPPSRSRAPLLAAMVDAGVPEGAAASVAYRPWQWLRVEAGGMHNLIGPGLRAGISLIPFYFWITPSLNLEVGHFFSGDATWMAHRFTSSRNIDPLFQRVGYDFGSAHLGLEIGSPSGVSFFLQVGASYVQMSSNGVQQVISDPTIQASDIKLTGVIPSAKLGMTIYFF